MGQDEQAPFDGRTIVEAGLPTTDWKVPSARVTFVTAAEEVAAAAAAARLVELEQLRSVGRHVDSSKARGTSG